VETFMINRFIAAARRTAPRRGAVVVVVLAAFAGTVVAGAGVPPNQDRERRAASEAELRLSTQRLLDAIAPGQVAVWDELLDADVIQVDENDVVRRKPEILAELKPLSPGLIGHLRVDDFQLVLEGDVAVVTHEDDETLDYHGQLILSRFRMTETWHQTPVGWRLLASQVLAVLKDPPAVTLDHSTLCAYAGNYSMTSEIKATIRCSAERLIFERSGRPARELLAEVRDVFFEPGQPRTRRIFQRDSHGRVTGFVDRREARDVVWRRVG
jgi:hypothetical protein